MRSPSCALAPRLGARSTPGSQFLTKTLDLQLFDLDKAISVGVIADFDTGALEMYTDLSTLLAYKIVKETLTDIYRMAFHLGQRYVYVLKGAIIRAEDRSGKSREIKKTLVCVRD